MSRFVILQCFKADMDAEWEVKQCYIDTNSKNKKLHQ